MFIGIINRKENDKNKYIDLIKRFKCRPVMLTRENINLINICSGFILPGGDNFTIDDEIISHALNFDKPLLGICLGMQALGCFDIKEDKLIDVTILNKTDINHNIKEKYVHDIIINKNTKLYSVFNKTEIKVNSRHNYHIEKLNKFIISSKSKDGIIEAIEVPNKFILGVQWHPEGMIDYDNDQYNLINTFINECRRYYEKNKGIANSNIGSFRSRKRYNL